MSCARTITLLCIFLELCPFDHLQCYFITKLCPLYNLITVKDVLMKFHTFVKHIETVCHAQEP